MGMLLYVSVCSISAALKSSHRNSVQLTADALHK